MQFETGVSSSSFLVSSLFMSRITGFRGMCLKYSLLFLVSVVLYCKFPVNIRLYFTLVSDAV